MKILTLNTHSYLEKEHEEKLEYLIEVLKEKNYDLIAFQEVNQYKDGEIVEGEMNESNFIRVVQKRLKEYGIEYNCRWDYSHNAYDFFHEGTGILYKGNAEYTNGEFIGIRTEHTYFKTRKYTMVSLKIDTKIIDFYCCHMGWWKDEANPFEIQMDQIAEIVNKRNNVTFLMGDFNNDANVRDEGYDYVLSKGFFDTYKLAMEKDDGITVPGTIIGWEGKSDAAKRIDYIFTNTDIKVKSSKVIFNGKNKEVVSDHFGVEVVIEL